MATQQSSSTIRLYIQYQRIWKWMYALVAFIMLIPCLQGLYRCVNALRQATIIWGDLGWFFMFTVFNGMLLGIAIYQYAQTFKKIDHAKQTLLRRYRGY